MRPTLPALLAALALAQPLFAVNGTWSLNGSGAWSVPTNWSLSTVASGTDAIADFSSLNITADRSVSLDSARTVGTLRFGDTTPSHNWSLTTNSTSNTFTLATSSGAPAISVSNQAATISLALSGSQGFSKLGPGTLILARANTYTGNTTISAGTLVSAIDNALPASTSLTITSGAVYNLNGFDQTLASASGSITSSAFLSSFTLNTTSAGTAPLLSGALSFTKSGPAALIVSAPLTHTGITRIAQGTLLLNTNNALPAASNLIVAAGAVLDLNARPLTVAGTNAFNNETGIITNANLNVATTLTLAINNNIAVSPSFTGNLSLLKKGASALTFTSASSNTGSTTIEDGIVTAGINNALSPSSPLTLLAPATYDLFGRNQSLLSLAGDGTLTNSSPTRSTLNLAAFSPYTLPTAITGNLNLAFQGPSSITLAQPLAHTGSTSLQAGTLTAAAPNAIPPSSLLVLSAAARFDLNGNPQQLALLTGTGTLTNTSATPANFTLASTANAATVSSILAGNLSFTAAGTQITLSRANTYTGNTFLQSGTLSLNASNALPATTSLFMNPGTSLDVLGNNLTLAGLNGAGAITTSSNTLFFGNAFTINTQTNSASFASVAPGFIPFIKAGPATLALNGPLTLITDLQLNAGLLALGGNAPHTAQRILGPGALQIEANASLTSAHFNLGALTVKGAHNLATNTTSPSTTTLLTLAGTTNAWTARLNLAGSPLIVQRPATASAFDTVSTLHNQLQFARANNWLANGITSSTVASNPTQFTLALFPDAFLLFPSFKGQPLDANSILITPALLGDADLSGTVDLGDFDRWFNNVGSTTFSYSRGDFDLSSIVDLADFDLWFSHVGAVSAAFPQAASLKPQASAPIPEPASLALLLPAALLLKRRRQPSRSGAQPSGRRTRSATRYALHLSTHC